jgi:hypothetical protein
MRAASPTGQPGTRAPHVWLREAFDLSKTGAALVRPDGYVAWRRSAPGGAPVRAFGE